nr:PREDICTED: spermatogenesis-associated protein 9 [Latimeria chalumnae]|eukprot:XP_014340509.1 PREDICTED: spermatogenesis-associated protein 9 [Latimeria chalumnae]
MMFVRPLGYVCTEILRSFSKHAQMFQRVVMEIIDGIKDEIPNLLSFRQSRHKEPFLKRSRTLVAQCSRTIVRGLYNWTTYAKSNFRFLQSTPKPSDVKFVSHHFAQAESSTKQPGNQNLSAQSSNS